MTDPLPGNEPPESLADLAREHPGLVLAGGLAVGLLVGALIPRRKGGRLLRNAASLAAVAGELALRPAKRQKMRAIASSTCRTRREPPVVARRIRGWKRATRRAKPDCGWRARPSRPSPGGWIRVLLFAGAKR